MAVENVRNRDLFLKICFMYYLIHILKILGIKEEIVEIMPTELISMEIKNKPKIFDNFLDFKVLTKSGKILVFEFKKNPLTTKDIKQVYLYCDRVHCKEKREVVAIIIVISKLGKIKEYTKFDHTYHPRIIKTKNINKQKDLKIIMDKFKNNVKLTTEECSLLIALPLFELKEDESEIVEEMCINIKCKPDCIPKGEIDGIIMGMYLNILEYVDEEKQKELMEMIDLNGKFEGELARIEAKGERNLILRLLEDHSLDEVSNLLKMGKNEISAILEMQI
jgi:hypothetical protein